MRADNGEMHNVVGFSCGSTQSITERIATFEVIERLYSDPKLLRIHDASCPTVEFPGGHYTIPTAASDAVRGTIVGGYAYGESLEKSICIAVLELCERYLLSTLSLDAFVKLSEPIQQATLLMPGIDLAAFTIRNSRIPLVRIALYNRTSQIFVIGSSLRLNLEDSVAHAFAEAVMLYDSVDRNERPNYDSPKKVVYYDKMRGPHAASEYRGMKCLPSIRRKTFDDRLDPREVVSDVFGKSIKIAVAILKSSDAFCVVKAILPNKFVAKSLQQTTKG